MTTRQKFGAWKPVEIFDSIEFFYNVKFTISNVTSERNSQKRKSSKEIICPEMKFPCIVENIQTFPQINTRWSGGWNNFGRLDWSPLLIFGLLNSLINTSLMLNNYNFYIKFFRCKRFDWCFCLVYPKNKSKPFWYCQPLLCPLDDQLNSLSRHNHWSHTLVVYKERQIWGIDGNQKIPSLTPRWSRQDPHFTCNACVVHKWRLTTHWSIYPVLELVPDIFLME